MARRLVISGRVQGVFYRAWSANEARALGLQGWVRNRRDGKVEMLIDGEAGAMERMIASCRDGPPEARVDQIEVEETQEQAPSGFEKRPTV